MAKLILFVNTTLEGVIQAPGRPDEDVRNGFAHGGWAEPYNAMQDAGEQIASIGALLLGRVTYEAMFDFWPKQVGNPMSERLRALPKYVVSRTLRASLPWENSVLIGEEVAAAVKELKATLERDLVIFGSSELCGLLIEQNLIDDYVLLIHPLVLGSGLKLFPEGTTPLSLHLVESRATASGVLVARYQPVSPSEG